MGDGADDTAAIQAAVNYGVKSNIPDVQNHLISSLQHRVQLAGCRAGPWCFGKTNRLVRLGLLRRGLHRRSNISRINQVRCQRKTLVHIYVTDVSSFTVKIYYDISDDLEQPFWGIRGIESAHLKGQ